MLVFVLLQMQGVGQGVDDGGAGTGFLAAFQAYVVVDADAGEGGQFLTAQSGVRRGPGPTVSPASAGVIAARRARRKLPSSVPPPAGCSRVMLLSVRAQVTRR